jgi:hypothetical protein
MPAPQLHTFFATFTTDNLGQINVQDHHLGGILNIEAFSKVNVEIVQWPQAATPLSMTVQCNMGKISGPTLAQTVGKFPLSIDGAIHTFDVVGPEFVLALTGGPPNTAVPLQAWIFIH